MELLKGLYYLRETTIYQSKWWCLCL